MGVHTARVLEFQSVVDTGCCCWIARPLVVYFSGVVASAQKGLRVGKFAKVFTLGNEYMRERN